PIPNPPWCGRPPRTVPLACTEPRRSPRLEHPRPDSSRLLCGLLILSWTPLPQSLLRPLHNPPPSPHPADPQSAAAKPTVRQPPPLPPPPPDPQAPPAKQSVGPSPFPPPKIVLELQSPFWPSPSPPLQATFDSLFYQIFEDLSSMRATPLRYGGPCKRIDPDP